MLRVLKGCKYTIIALEILLLAIKKTGALCAPGPIFPTFGLLIELLL